MVRTKGALWTSLVWPRAVKMLPAGGCTQECSQEESALSSPLPHSPNLLARVPAYSFEVFTSFFFFFFLKLLFIPQHFNSWASTDHVCWLWSYHQCCDPSAGPSRLLAHALPWPQFWYPPLEKFLISLLKTWQAAWSFDVTTLIWPPATDTTTCIKLFPANNLSWCGVS